MDEQDKDRGIAYQTSTSRFLTSCMESGGSRVNFAKKRAALNVRVEIIGTELALHNARNEELYLPVTGARYLLTGHHCQDQTSHNDSEIRERQSPESVLVCTSEALCLLVRLASQNYLQYSYG